MVSFRGGYDFKLFGGGLFGFNFIDKVKNGYDFCHIL